uniref:Complex I-B12 n=1 Tax=Trichobilharzia regenti TaxID=157069 RepID=A0AA85K4D3_TRIRE|nr:unnamed protein product [Trichobilharzia regenti]
MKVDWQCPDWRSYNTDHPSLKAHVEKLAKHGLKDPWIRNYAWHYSPKIYKTRFQWVKELFLRRLPHGIALGLAATVVINGFDHWRRQQEHHVSTAEH